MGKKRLDVILTEEGFFSSREQARRAIMAGQVFVGNVREDKPGTGFDPDRMEEITVKGERLPFVSRGGLKLQKAMETFAIDLHDAVCLDIGASTGGFTDCMLQHGAAKVYAVDVGYGQLAYALMTDDRVVPMERTNFRYLTSADFPEAMDFATADVSFISLDKILPVASTLLKEDGRMVCLVKPQFEAGRDKVGKKGVVRDKAVHIEVLERTLDMALQEGLTPAALNFSPVTGAEGNIEYLLYLEKTPTAKAPPTKTHVKEIVDAAHAALTKEGRKEQAL